MFRALALLVVFVLVSSSFLTPPIYSAFEAVQMWPFSRVYHRVAMLMTLIGLYLFREQFHLSQIRSEIPWPKDRSWRAPLLIGVFAASVFSFPLYLWFIEMRDFYWEDRAMGELAWKTARYIPSAIIVSCIEETFFRWFLFRRLQRVYSVYIAAVITSALYAFVHFISPDKGWEYPGYSLWVGFEYLLRVGERMTMPGILEGSFGLFLVGLVLCCIFQKTGRLSLCIGLHAGWVLAVKFAGLLLEPPPGFEYPGGAGRRYFLVTEPISWLSILAVGVLAWLLWKIYRRSSSLETASIEADQKED